MTKINQEEYEVLKELDDKWKWITRAEAGVLVTFELKPRKDVYGIWKCENSGEIGVYSSFVSLFQIIQWEDQEPHSITKLIEEYENEEFGYYIMDAAGDYEQFIEESEETEVKKQDLRTSIEQMKTYKFGAYDKHHDTLSKVTSYVKKSAVLHLLNQLDEPEVLSQEWLNKNKREWTNIQGTKEYVAVDKLQNLLVPKQEEVDRAYKDGYEEGRELGFYKGYREGLADKGGEPETVADVIADFYESCGRLQGVMSMEVEELEE